MIDQSIKAAVSASVAHFIDMANAKLGKAYTYPEVRYDLKGKAAGMIEITMSSAFRTAELNGWYIRINPVLLVENLNYMLEQTIPHEIAHLLDIDMYGGNFTKTGRLQQHGRSWKAIMMLLGVDPKRTHSMDTSRTQGRKHRKVAYVCSGCGKKGEIGIVRANKIRRGTAAYKHNKCGGRIELL